VKTLPLLYYNFNSIIKQEKAHKADFRNNQRS